MAAKNYAHQFPGAALNEIAGFGMGLPYSGWHSGFGILLLQNTAHFGILNHVI
jgi:hypothetical protein